MNQKVIARNLVLILLIAFTASFSYEIPAKKFNPAGTWEYSAPSAPEGYGTGQMVVEKKEKSYGVALVFGGSYKVDAHEVEYKRKSLKFSLYVESDLVTISGTFDDDNFTGTASYSEGVIDFTAVRKKEEEK